MAENTPDTTDPTPVVEPAAVVAPAPAPDTALEPGWVPPRTTTTSTEPVAQSNPAPVGRPVWPLVLLGAVGALLLLWLAVFAAPWTWDNVIHPFGTMCSTAITNLTTPRPPQVINNDNRIDNSNSNNSYVNSNNCAPFVIGDVFGGVVGGNNNNVAIKICGSCGKKSHKGACSKASGSQTTKKSGHHHYTPPPVRKKTTTNPLGNPTSGSSGNPIFIAPVTGVAPVTPGYTADNVETGANNGTINLDSQRP